MQNSQPSQNVIDEYVALAKTRERDGDIAGAVECYALLLKTDPPNRFELLNARGRLLLRLERPEAVDDFTRAYDLQPRRHDMLFYRAIARYALVPHATRRQCAALVWYRSF
jgi:tetratricopeptide (TPR) repeat protein